MSISTTFEVQSGCSADSGHKSFSLLPKNYSGRKKLGVAGCCFLFLLVVIEVSKGRRDGKKHNQTKHTHQTIEKNLECWEQALFVRSFVISVRTRYSYLGGAIINIFFFPTQNRLVNFRPGIWNYFCFCWYWYQQSSHQAIVVPNGISVIFFSRHSLQFGGCYFFNKKIHRKIFIG